MSADLDDGGLEVVVHSSATLLQQASADVADLHQASSQQAADLDSAEARADRILQRLGIEAPTPSFEPAQRRMTERKKDVLTDSAVRERAAANLLRRGIEPASASLDELIDPKELACIRKRFYGDAQFSARLDRIDLAAAITAGIVGGVVDSLLVNTPKTSQLTETIKGLSIRSDNWLAGLVQVPYDKAWDAEI